MSRMPAEKYRPGEKADLPDRTWPSRTINHAPVWCSVDLRDGNQALPTPMAVEEKLEMFHLLVRLGFKEIEVGFPSASQTEFDFLRVLIDEGHIPGDVTIQVLTQARKHLIERTFAAIKGARRAILHLYNSTSALQRQVVFRTGRAGIKDLAVEAAGFVKEEAQRLKGTEVLYEYSPESFTATELDYALDICNAVMDVWEPAPDRKAIVNLPSTVEMNTPNVYADRIEWMCRNLARRNSLIVSVHAHNDRGTAVAATELALLAGGERVEGTLFGNGERTGNVDLLTLALNLYTQGVDPCLDIHDMKHIVEVYERCTKIPVHLRHPYAGEMVYTAFSGSHQDAIDKGLKALVQTKSSFWEVPYLPMDPADIGRNYESLIRINSQSGKGGIAHVMETHYGLKLPREMCSDFSSLIQAICDNKAVELAPSAVMEAFEAHYLQQASPYSLLACRIQGGPDSEGIQPAGQERHEQPDTTVWALIGMNGVQREITGQGNGPIDAFCNAFKEATGVSFTFLSYHEHALGRGSDSKAAAYIQIEDCSGKAWFGAGLDTNISIASIKALLSAVNKAQAQRTPLLAQEAYRDHQE